NDYIASTGENRIFVANEDGLGDSVACGVFRAVHEPQKIALVKVAECLDFVDRSDRACDPRQDLRSELETEIHPFGTDVKDQVPGCRNGVSWPRAKLKKRMKFGGPR